MFKRKIEVPHICGEENHLFEPRYNYNVIVELELSPMPSPESAIKALEVAKRGDYIYDICIYCGKTVSFIHQIMPKQQGKEE